MIRNNTANDKKRALLAQKEKILQEIKYYEKRIDEFSNENSSVYFGADSSDSDDGFPTFLDIGPSISELKRQDRLLKTCLQATQELTSVTVLESEVQVLVKDPDIGSEKPVSEPGLWREVTAECRIDLVPFTILFYVHQPSQRFSAASYRGLRVQAVKASQEAELATSVLHSLTSPADILETLRSYASAYRSRRGSLARLADRHAATLYMQPRDEGGFVLKCGTVMQMSWRLENKTSPLAPFQHKMNFELEYMDESFLKIIRQAHRQLSDPSLQTDERTQLLSKIINTCVEAQGQENVESDTDSKKLEKTMLDDDDSDVNVEERDREVMAPPKSIPKRSKPKGKENDDGNRKSVKRSLDQVDGSVKRVRTDAVDVNDSFSKNNSEIEKTHEVIEGSDDKSGANVKNKDPKKQISKKVTKISKNGQEKSIESETKKNKNENQNKAKSTKNSEAKNDDKENNDNITSKTIEQNITEKVTQKVNSKNSNTTDIEVVTKNPKNNQTRLVSKNSEPVHSKKIENSNNTKKSVNSNDKDAKNVNSSDKSKKSDNSEIANIKKVTKSDNTKNIDSKTVNPKKNETKNTKSVKTGSTNVKKSVNSDSTNTKKTVGSNSAKTKKVLETDTVKESINADSANAVKIVNSVTEKTKKVLNSDSNAKKSLMSDITNAKKVVSTDYVKTKKIENSAITKKSGNADSARAKKIVNSDSTNAKNIEVSSFNSNKILNTDKKTANSTTKDITTKNINATTKNNPKKLSEDVKMSKIVIKNHRNSSGKVTKKSVSLKLSGKESKIPQKKLSPAYAAVLKQNPLRISPRMLSKFKSPSDSNIQSKLFKPVTNIPRLLKKPAPKSK